MQHAVFFFMQIFFVVLAVSVVGIVIFTIFKNRNKEHESTSSEKPSKFRKDC